MKNLNNYIKEGFFQNVNAKDFPTDKDRKTIKEICNWVNTKMRDECDDAVYGYEDKLIIGEKIKNIPIWTGFIFKLSYNSIIVSKISDTVFMYYYANNPQRRFECGYDTIAGLIRSSFGNRYKAHPIQTFDQFETYEIIK